MSILAELAWMVFEGIGEAWDRLADHRKAKPNESGEVGGGAGEDQTEDLSD